MKVLFLGTAPFACPALEALLASPHRVMAVITQPDRPRGRGQKEVPTPVKALAVKAGLPVLQPEKLRDPSFLPVLTSLAPEVLVVVAYGQILPPPILSLPPRGCVNVHASLLPRYRGAAPIVRAILDGETRSGVTTMLLDRGMDTGPVLLSEETEIGEEETAGALHDRLAGMGARLLLRTLEGLEKEALSPTPQDHARATYAPKIEKEESRLDWDLPARELANRIRAFDPWPGAFTTLSGRVLKLFLPRVREENPGEAPGTVIRASAEGLWVSTPRGVLRVGEVQLDSRPRMTVAEFLRGNPLPGAVRLGS